MTNLPKGYVPEGYVPVDIRDSTTLEVSAGDDPGEVYIRICDKDEHLYQFALSKEEAIGFGSAIVRTAQTGHPHGPEGVA